MSAQCNRVAVEDGHTESVSVKLKKAAKPEEIMAAWNEFRSVPQELQLLVRPSNRFATRLAKIGPSRVSTPTAATA